MTGRDKRESGEGGEKRQTVGLKRAAREKKAS